MYLHDSLLFILHASIIVASVSVISFSVLDQKWITTESLCPVIDCINVKWAGEDRHQSFIMREPVSASCLFGLLAYYVPLRNLNFKFVPAETTSHSLFFFFFRLKSSIWQWFQRDISTTQCPKASSFEIHFSRQRVTIIIAYSSVANKQINFHHYYRNTQGNTRTQASQITTRLSC